MSEQPTPTSPEPSEINSATQDELAEATANAEETNRPQELADDPLETLRAALADKHNEYLRAKADTENVRRRAVEDRIKAQRFAVESFASDLLPVVDAFKMALENRAAPLDKILEGVDMTQKLLVQTLEKHGVKTHCFAG
jgi:molecular chaperone GrpE